MDACLFLLNAKNKCLHYRFQPMTTTESAPSDWLPHKSQQCIKWQCDPVKEVAHRDDPTENDHPKSSVPFDFNRALYVYVYV